MSESKLKDACYADYHERVKRKKVSVSVVAGSSTPQWVCDAGAISHGITASNHLLARILTDTLISRSPHCVLGARYDGNVNLFYVVMTGSGKPRVSMVFPGTNFITSSRFAGERRKSIRHAQSGNIQCLQNEQLFILASKHRVLPKANCFPRAKRPWASSIR